MEDLALDSIDAYRAELVRHRPGCDLVNAPIEGLLLETGAAIRDKGRLQPTLAGMLFFGQNPQYFYPSFTVTFLHFAGTSMSVRDPRAPIYLDNREFGGRLPEVIDAVRRALLERLSKQAIVRGFVREEMAEYPEIAYREAIVNAIAHRDYEMEGSFIQVRLFADRLEIQSPGGLAGHLTVDNIAYEQYTRNPRIMRLLEDYGYVERRGLGVDLMIRAMVDAGHKPPAFENRGSSFWVTLRGNLRVASTPDLAQLGLNERQIAAVDLLRKEGRLTNRAYQQAFHVSERTALYDLQGLVEAGLALPVSSGRGRYYILRG
jgi:ATP-dependent DNA helicase RecG